MADAQAQVVQAIATALPGGARYVLIASYDPERCEQVRRAMPGRDVTVLLTPDMAGVEGTAFDCVVAPDLFATGADPVGTLADLRGRLAAGGGLLAAFPNARHHRRLAAWLWDGPSRTPGDGTLAEAYRALLDAGFVPEVAGRALDPAPPGFHAALGPLLDHLGVHRARAQYHLDTAHWALRGTPQPEVRGEPEAVTVSVCLSDAEVFRANLGASPDLAGGGHELLTWPGCPNAAAGHNRALARPRHAWVLCVHQDVYLPRGWFARFRDTVRRAEEEFGRLDVVGVYGVATEEGVITKAGHVLDRERRLCEAATLPRLVSSLDELLIAVRADAGLRFDPALGWHLYGTDICLAAQSAGGRAAVIDAVCLHDQRAVEPPKAFGASARYLALKWPGRLPLGTPCDLITSH